MPPPIEGSESCAGVVTGAAAGAPGSCVGAQLPQLSSTKALLAPESWSRYETERVVPCVRCEWLAG
jgi:hypothetical protein